MRLLAILIVVVAWFASPEVEATGFRFIDIPADANGPALTGAVWSPCDQPPQQMRVGMVTIARSPFCRLISPIRLSANRASRMALRPT